MKRRLFLLVLGTLLHGVVAFNLPAAETDALKRREWLVEGQKREALVCLPANATPGSKAGEPAPIICVFHGHGGTMWNAAEVFRLHVHWPEAVVVYMQGLNTPGRLTDPEGKKSGWQHQAGDHGDRDLKFFDAVLASLKREARVDFTRIYATGHSNGGAFTYILWEARSAQIAAYAPSAAVISRPLKSRMPRPILHLAGLNDPLVKYSWQEMLLDEVRTINLCKKPGVSWDDVPGATYYESSTGTPVVLFLHSGGHKFPAAAPEIIIKFFKRFCLSAVSAGAG